MGGGPGLFLVQPGLGQPEADVMRAPGLGAAQPVDGQAGGHGHQPGLGLVQRGAVGRMPAQPDVLHQFLGVGHAAQHAVGDALQPGPQAVEQGGVGVHGSSDGSARWFVTRRAVLMLS